MTSFAVGTALGAAGAHQNLLREAAAAAVDPAARAAADARYADVTTLGNRLAFVGPAAGQLLSDADNPRFSAAERAGRAAARGRRSASGPSVGPPRAPPSARCCSPARAPSPGSRWAPWAAGAGRC